MKFLSDILAKAGLTVDGVVTLNNTATGQTPDANDNSTKLATTAWVRGFVTPYSLPIASSVTLGGIKIGSGLAIDGTGVVSITTTGTASIKSTQTFTATAAQTVFTISGGYTAGLIDVFLNGVYLSPNQTTATNGTTVTLADAASSGDIIDVIITSPIYQGSVITTDQLPEGSTNLYYTNARARAAISLTTTGTSGSATYNSSTGVLNIPSYIGGVVSIFGRTGTVIAVSGDYTTTLVTEGTNLYYTDARARAAISVTGSGSYDSATGIITITGGVTSFNTRTGAITPTSGDYTTALVTESGNLYYTDARARAAISLTTTGTSGAASYNNTTGVLNIPQYQGGVTSFNTRTGAITLTSSDVTTALTYTPVTNARTLTINGDAYDLTADRTWTIGVTPSARTIQTYTATAAQTTFTVTGGYVVGLVDVFINGVRLTSADFTATNGTTVVLTTGTGVNNIVDVIKYTSAFTATNALRQVTNFTATAGQTSFTVSYTPGLIDVFYNGSKLVASEYTASNGTTVVLANAAVLNDLLEIISYSYTVGAYSGQTQLNGTGLVRMSGTTVSYDNATYATESYVTTAVANLVDAAPATLDTLNELAAALGDDPNFATTIATSIGTKQPQLNGTGFVKISGTTISYDNSTYLTTASASSTYVPYTGATGAVNLGAYDLKVNGLTIGKGAGNLGQNVALGYNVLVDNASGNYNTGVGTSALSSLGTGSYNTVIGYSAGMSIYSGSNNTIVGIYAGASTLSSNVIIADGAGNIRFQWDGSNIKLNGNTVGSNAYTSTAYLPLAGGTLTGDLSIAYTTSNLRLFLNNTTATTGRSWYLNSFSNGNLYIGNTTASDVFNFSSAGVATFSYALSGTSATFSSTGSFGNASLNGAYLVVKGANGVPASSGTTTTAVFRVSSGTGLYNVLDFGTNESDDYSWMQSTRANSLGTYDRLLIQPNGGAVRIGGTGTTSYKLLVDGTLGVTGAATFSSSITSTSGNITANGDIVANSGSSTAVYVYNASSVRAKLSMTGNEGDLSLYGSSANRLVYLSAYYDSYIVAGKVGIGTTGPVAKLHVEGSTAIGTTGTEDILILGRAIGGGASFQQAASLKLGRYQNAGGSFESYTRLDFALRDNSAASNYNTNTTVMTLTNAGSVGIGSVNPLTFVEVRKGGTSTTPTNLFGGNPTISVISGEPGIAFSSNIVAATGAVSTSQTALAGVGFTYINSTSPTEFNIGIYGAPTVSSNVTFWNQTERMRIASNGAITMLVPTGGQTLSIFGKNNNWCEEVIGSSTTGQSYGLLVTAGTNSADYSFYVQNQAGTSPSFRIRGDSLVAFPKINDFTTGNSPNTWINPASSYGIYINTSSIRYKRDVINYDKGLSIVDQLRPVYYKGTSEVDGDKQFAGFIAEEVNDLGLTEFVNYLDDGRPNSLSYPNMLALAVKAIQELKTQNDLLKDRLDKNNIN
jgi:hypothetical protein